MNISSAELRQALKVCEQIEKLEVDFQAVLSTAARSTPRPSKQRKKKRKMSPEAREKIASGQRKRWAALKKKAAGRKKKAARNRKAAGKKQAAGKKKAKGRKKANDTG